MRIGILGGTFDPVHYGHLIAAETCRERLKLDQVRLIPAASPPHKPGVKIADGHARADMLSLAVSGYPEFIVDRRELKRSGPSYTVDTLRELTAEYPGHDLYFLMGADSLRDLLAWREPEEIARLATIVACNRPGVADVTSSQIAEWVGQEIAARVLSMTMPGSSHWRQAGRRGGACLRLGLMRGMDSVGVGGSGEGTSPASQARMSSARALAVV